MAMLPSVHICNSTRARMASLAAAGMLAALPLAARAADPMPADPVQILANIQKAARTQDYAGVFMYQQGEMMQSSRLVHIIDGTGERERLEVLDGQPREYLRHNDDVQCLMPERKTVLVERRRGDRFPGLLLGEPAAQQAAQLVKHYEIRASDKLHRVADRQCRVITIEPRDALRYGYRLCADTETNLLLKAQTLDASRRIVEQIAFTSIRVGGGVDVSQLGSRWNTNEWKIQQADMKPVDLAAQGWRISAPDGFAPVLQVERRMGQTAPAGVSQLVLSDGLAAISVFIEPYNGAKHGHSPAGLVRRGAINIYGKRVADFWLTVLGEVPVATLEQLAGAVEYVPH